MSVQKWVAANGLPMLQKHLQQNQRKNLRVVNQQQPTLYSEINTSNNHCKQINGLRESQPMHLNKNKKKQTGIFWRVENGLSVVQINKPLSCQQYRYDMSGDMTGAMQLITHISIIILDITCSSLPKSQMNPAETHIPYSKQRVNIESRVPKPYGLISVGPEIYFLNDERDCFLFPTAHKSNVTVSKHINFKETIIILFFR